MTNDQILAKQSQAQDELTSIESLLPKLAQRAHAENCFELLGEDAGKFDGAKRAHADAQQRIRELKDLIDACDFMLAHNELRTHQAQIEASNEEYLRLSDEQNELFDAAPWPLRHQAVIAGTAPAGFNQHRPDPEREARYNAISERISEISRETERPRQRISEVIKAHPALAECA